MSLCMQDLAEQAGDTDKVGELTRKLEELEERAEELDKQRSKGLSAIRSVHLQEHACIDLHVRMKLNQSSDVMNIVTG